MYRKAYDFVTDILRDKQIDDYIFNLTGKHLAVINAGAQFKSPSVQISFNGGNSSRKQNTATPVSYTLSFSLPIWGTDAFLQCVDFIDFVIPIIFDYSDGLSFVANIEPAITEPEEISSQDWLISLTVTLTIIV